MKTKITSFILLFVCTSLFSQENPTKPIRSPQVADMIRYDNVPIAKNSGRLDLNIDLIGIDDSDFEMPVKACYNSSGFIPSKPESCIGFNWSLSYGGVIYREVKGIPDDIGADSYHIEKKSFLHLIKNKYIYSQESVFNNPSQYLSFPTGIAYFKDNNIEMSSDIYYFNFGRHSGEFSIDLDGIPKVVSYGGGSYKVDISGYNFFINNESPTILKITTDDGYEYYFGGSRNNMEYSVSYTNSTGHGSSRVYPSSFFLYQIVAPNGRILKLKYKEIPEQFNTYPPSLFDDSYYSTLKSYTANFIFTSSATLTVNNGTLEYNPTLQAFFPIYTSSCDRSYILTKIALIDEVEIDKQKLKFYYSSRSAEKKRYKSTGGLQLGSSCGAMLDSISLSYNDERVKSVSFRYKYYGNNYPIFFLDQLALTKNETYSFAYNTCEFPDPLSMDTDYWNFWRDIDPDNYPIPNIVIYNNSDFKYETESREPGLKSIDCGLIKKITYPTKGMAEIVYEHHIYSKKIDRTSISHFKPALIDLNENLIAGGARVRSIIYSNDKEVKKVGYEYSVSKTNLKSSGILTHYPRYAEIINYIIVYQDNGTIIKTVPPSAIYSNIGTNISAYEKDHVVYSSVTEVNVESESNPSITLSSPVPLQTTGETSLGTVTIDKGIGLWVICGMKPGDAVLYMKQNNQIKKTINISGDPPTRYIPDVESGTYNLTYTKAASYGFYINMTSPIQYKGAYSIAKFTDYSTNPDQFEDDKLSSHASNAPLTSLTDFGRNYYRISQNCSRERGLPISTEDYTTDSKLVHSLNYTYSKSMDRFTPYTIFHHTFIGFVDQLSKTYYYSYLPIEKFEKTYNSNNNSFVQQTESYTYDNKGYLKENSSSNSNLEIIKTKYSYPFNLSDPVSNQMKDANILSPIRVEEKSLYNKTGGLIQLLKQKRNNYISLNHNPNKLFALSTVEESMGTSPFVERYRCHNFDGTGNPIYITDRELSIVYLWSYHGQYPIAEIKGATYDQVKTALGVAPESLSKEVAPNMNLINALRTKLPHALVNTYTFRPLVGMSTSINPHGMTTYYGYDSFGRLTSVKDNNTNITKNIDYQISGVVSDNAIKYYYDVTLDNTASGGDGTIVTKSLEVGSTLPIPEAAIGYTFIGWFDGKTKITIVPDSPHKTLIARFEAVVIKDNVINAYLGSRHGGTAFYINVTAKYPLRSDIALSFIARGDYYVVHHYPDGSDRMEFFDFDGLNSHTTLKAGESKWSLLYTPGIDSSGTIDRVNWGVAFKEFSDIFYNYIKGTTNGLESL